MLFRSGIAPVLASSGQQRWVHYRWACPKFVRQTIHEWALHSLGQCAWARDYYQRQLARGKSHHAAVRALAFKWLRILFRCWQNRTPYQEPIYQQALQRRAGRSPGTGPTPLPTAGPNAPLTAPSSNPTDPASALMQLRWESVAGFFKLAFVTP